MCNMYKLELVLNTNLNSTDEMLHIYILFNKLFLVFPQSHFMNVKNLV